MSSNYKYQNQLSTTIKTMQDGIFDTDTIYTHLQSFKECLNDLINDKSVRMSKKFAILNDYYNMKVHNETISTDQVTLLYFVLHQIKRNRLHPMIVGLCWQTYNLLLENDALPSITPLMTINRNKKKRKYIYSFQLCRILRQILDKCDDVTDIECAQRIIQTLQNSCDKHGNVLLPSVLTYISSNIANHNVCILYFNGIYDKLPSFEVLQQFINSKFFYNEYFPLMQCYKTPSLFRIRSYSVIRRWSNIKKEKFDSEEMDQIVKRLVRNSQWNILFIRDLFGDFMYKQMFNTLQKASSELHDDHDFPILYDNAIHVILSYWFKSDFLFLYEDKIESDMLRTILVNIHKMDNESINWFLDHSIESMLDKHKGRNLHLDGYYYFNLYKKKTYSLDVLERLLPFFIPSITVDKSIMLLAKGIESERIIAIFTDPQYGFHLSASCLWLVKNKYNDCCNLFELMKYKHYKENKNVRSILIYFAAVQSGDSMIYIRLLFTYFFAHYTDKTAHSCLWGNIAYFIRQLLLKKNGKRNKLKLEQYVSKIFISKNVAAFEMLTKYKFLNVIKLIKNKHINEMMQLLIPRIIIIECDDSNLALLDTIIHWIVSQNNDKNIKWIKKFFRIWIANAKRCEDQRCFNILLKYNEVITHESMADPSALKF